MANERDFAGKDLRNRSFRNQDLQGADFSRSDLRGCDFYGANLQNSSFEEARMGLSYQQIMLMVLVAIALVVVFALVVIFARVVVLARVLAFEKAIVIALAILSLVALAITSVTTATKGVTKAKAFILTLKEKFIEDNFDVELMSFWVSKDHLLLKIIRLSIAYISPIAAFTIAVGFMAGRTSLNALSAVHAGDIMNGIIYVLVSIVFKSFFVASVFLFIRAIQSVKGTSFREANLTRSTFYKAFIRNTDFTDTRLYFVDWKAASFKSSDLSDYQKLLIERDGKKKDYSYMDFGNEILRDACLQQSNFSEGYLYDSDLTYADLREANLTAVEAMGTNFTNADFTGAIIQDWVITRKTILTHARCDYVYLNQDRNPQSRRPLSGNFRAGEFENLVTHLTQALGFILHHDDDPEAFFLSLGQLIQTYGERGLETGDIIRLPNGDRQFIVNTPPDFDNAKAHTETMANYENLRRELTASRQEIKYLESQLNDKSVDLVTTRQQLKTRTDELIATQRESLKYLQGFMSAKIPTLPIGENTNIYQPQLTDSALMSKGNQNIKSTGGGDISGVAGGDISGVAGKDQQGIAGRDLSGAVAIAVNALKETDNNPETLNLADLLAQLQTAIDKSDVDAEDKNTLLAEIETLAKNAQRPVSPDNKKIALKSLNVIKTIVRYIPALKTVVDLLPAIQAHFTD